MKIRVWNALMDQTFFHLDDLMKWPSAVELHERIASTPEFKAFAGVGLPLNQTDFVLRSGENVPGATDQVMEWLLERASHFVVRKWIESRIHRCLSQEDLEELYLKEGNPDRIYVEAQELFRLYYKRLTDNIVSTLYQDKQVYNLEELELLVPVVLSAYYNRDSVIQCYQSKINGLKTPEQRSEIQAQIAAFEKM